MKILYFDLISGASGDMILGALIDAGVSVKALKAELGALHLEEFDLQTREVSKNGFQATKVEVLIGKQPPERHLAEILEIIHSSDLPQSVAEGAAAIFLKIAQTEAGIHGTTLDQVHLHELGGTDTIVDVTGTLLALNMLEIDHIHASPVPLGSGFITGAHGQIPLPAPATIRLLEGIPVYGVDIQAELVTPTGAGLLSSLVDEFGPAPEMVLEAVGYGAGSRDLPTPNLLRALIGRSRSSAEGSTRQLILLESNLDDLNPEIYPYLMDRLFQEGALDVILNPVHMKKNRPGIHIQVLAEPSLADKLREILFLETTTLGVRQIQVTRHALPRKSVTVTTTYGKIRVKVASGPGGEPKISPEFEDCQKLAREHSLPLTQIYQEALNAYRAKHRE